MSLENLKNSQSAGPSKFKAASAGQLPLEPVVVSFSRAYKASIDGLTAGEVGDRLSEVLIEVAASIRGAGAFIGHIKALVSQPEGGQLGISVVKDKASRIESSFKPLSPVSTFKAAVTAIVYGCSPDELSRLLKLGLALGLPKNRYEELREGKPSSLLSFNSILKGRQTAHGAS